ncbi:serine kinase [uncultured Tateyamaria sp.]|uniref:HPr kinase/phosphorylase n=1 Tax=uncultured Tateyamaria sp. TaxID=455651 RepID=UPI002623E78B|nr:serine kinase [uncultured Tateyamaria sp.]
MLETLLHANAVAVDGQGVLITGASGSGKSSLSLQLMTLGAQLIADDQTQLRLMSAQVWASSPPTTRGLIEARGVGILTADPCEAPIALVIDLDLLETERLPQRHSVTLLDRPIICLHKVDNPAWPAAIMQYLKGSRRDPS